MDSSSGEIGESIAGDRRSRCWLICSRRASGIVRNASAAVGSNWVPAPRPSPPALSPAAACSDRAVRRHRIEGVGNRHDPRDERDVIALEAVRIALPSYRSW
jgi:hypothetical protein